MKWIIENSLLVLDGDNVEVTMEAEWFFSRMRGSTYELMDCGCFDRTGILSLFLTTGPRAKQQLLKIILMVLKMTAPGKSSFNAAQLDDILDMIQLHDESVSELTIEGVRFLTDIQLEKVLAMLLISGNFMVEVLIAMVEFEKDSEDTTKKDFGTVELQTLLCMWLNTGISLMAFIGD